NPLEFGAALAARFLAPATSLHAGRIGTRSRPALQEFPKTSTASTRPRHPARPAPAWRSSSPSAGLVNGYSKRTLRWRTSGIKKVQNNHSVRQIDRSRIIGIGGVQAHWARLPQKQPARDRGSVVLKDFTVRVYITPYKLRLEPRLEDIAKPIRICDDSLPAHVLI